MCGTSMLRLLAILFIVILQAGNEFVYSKSLYIIYIAWWCSNHRNIIQFQLDTIFLYLFITYFRPTPTVAHRDHAA